MQPTTTTCQEPARDDEDASYAALVAHVRDAVRHVGTLFTTDADGLNEAFLGALPAHRRQHHDCRACRHFLARFGALVTIDEAGRTHSPLWEAWPAAVASPFFAHATASLMRAVGKARVTGVFQTTDLVLGMPENISPKSPIGRWHHLHAFPDATRLRPRSRLQTADQAMAEMREEHHMLRRSLADFDIALVRKAHIALTTGALYRSEKCVGVAAWLLALHESLEQTKDTCRRDNLVWRAVATAPVGYAHVRTTMIGTLLEDLAAGKPFDEVRRAFDAKMRPDTYQRPQAAPNDGQLAAAEKLVASLASARSLDRRYASLEEVMSRAIWRPRAVGAPPPQQESVFGHLSSKAAAAAETLDVAVGQAMTWEKFRRTVLEGAERIELRVPAIGNFFAFVTAADPAAPPILQWDRVDARNPVSWYVYHGGSPAARWSLSAGEYAEVEAVMLQPSGWTRELAHHGDGAYLIVRGARVVDRAGLGLFPEILRSEYHGVRAALEAYSRSKMLPAPEPGVQLASGLAMQKTNTSWSTTTTVRVTSAGARVVYLLDRWD